MHKGEIERFAFLFLCGKHDRDILMEKEKMTFSDFGRLTYITDFLGLRSYHMEIWNAYAGQFDEQLRGLKNLYEETCSIVSWDVSEEDEHLQEQWMADFCRQVPDRKIRKQLEDIVKQLYKEYALEEPEEGKDSPPCPFHEKAIYSKW